MQFKIVPEAHNKYSVKRFSYDEKNTWWHEGFFKTEQEAKTFINRILLVEEIKEQEKKEREEFQKKNPPYIYP